MLFRRLFWFAPLLLTCYAGFGQKVKISFSAGVNLPFINDVIQTRIPPIVNPSTGFTSTFINVSYVDQKFETLPGLQGGFLAHYSLKQKFSLSAGLSATHFRYVQKQIVSSNGGQLIFQGVQPTTPIGTPIIIGTPIQATPGTIKFPSSRTLYPTPPDQGETNVTYLTLPVTADYSFAKKWSASAGLNAHIIMAANVKRYAYSYTATGGLILNQEDRTADGFTNVLVGAVSQVRYQIIKPLSIDLGYSYIFTPIYDQSYNTTSVDQPARYMLVSLSARYWLK